MKKIAITVSVGLLVLVVSAFALGHKKWVEPYVGVKVCSYCHKVQYDLWKNSVHAKAFDVLPKNQQNNRYCLSCHSLGTHAELKAVQCESCHGEGSQYAKSFVMKDKKLSKALGLVASPSKETCEKCHTGTCTKLKDFNFEEAIKKVRKECAKQTENPNGIK